MFQKSAYILLAFALFLAAGGCFAFAKAGSLISLISSTSFALLFSLCALAMLKKRPMGAYSALISLGFLACFLVMRLVQTRSFMPAGLLLMLTLCVFCITGIASRKVQT